jgi:hypothetical protein
MSTAQQLLDRVHSLAVIDTLAEAPQTYAELLAAELPGGATVAELEARDAALATALGQLDLLIARVMRIRLDHVLAADTSIGPPTRRVFASTIVRYANNLGPLAARVHDVAVRGRAAAPDLLTEAVIDAARATLALRDALREPVLAHVAALAAAGIADADRHARDRDADEPLRRRWSAARRELEAIAQDPARVAAAAFATRLASWPEQLDEPALTLEATFADMIELD